MHLDTLSLGRLGPIVCSDSELSYYPELSKSEKGFEQKVPSPLSWMHSKYFITSESGPII